MHLQGLLVPLWVLLPEEWLVQSWAHLQVELLVQQRVEPLVQRLISLFSTITSVLLAGILFLNSQRFAKWENP
ncbi:hypothetical protein A9165_15920 [Alishewanella sp. HH-ZS]|nr:hypothetical protein A9165_15920 [Alishewanella sp. HH-ZS]